MMDIAPKPWTAPPVLDAELAIGRLHQGVPRLPAIRAMRPLVRRMERRRIQYHAGRVVLRLQCLHARVG